MSHVPRKRFGQNFLHDSQIIAAIIQALAPEPGQALLEIGPGQGALTFPVLDKVKKFSAIELDRNLISSLQVQSKKHGELALQQGDALKINYSDFKKDGQRLRVFGNLPYNISTPLIFHLLEFRHDILDMHFMLQKEVVDRLAAKPNCKDYGRLSIMVQYHCRVDHLFDVPPEAFEPPPKVDSSIVRLTPYDKPPFPVKDFSTFVALVKQAFSQRRKTIRNCLKGYVTEELWVKSAVDPGSRAEQLDVATYVMLSDLITNNGLSGP